MAGRLAASAGAPRLFLKLNRAPPRKPRGDNCSGIARSSWAGFDTRPVTPPLSPRHPVPAIARPFHNDIELGKADIDLVGKLLLAEAARGVESRNDLSKTGAHLLAG